MVNASGDVWQPGRMMRRIILDTDLGTDVDDALALAVLLGSPEVELVGVTTVHGDTLLRARLARRLMGLAGAGAGIPVIPGLTHTLSGREVWWPGHEGALHERLEREHVQSELDAIAWLVDTVAAHPGEIDLLAVGPLTNVAAAIEADAAFAGRLRTLTIMGGDFSDANRASEHNLRCDWVAADRVLRSGAGLVAVGLDATRTVRITPEEVSRIGAAGALGAALVAEIGVWWELNGRGWSNPHDPVAAMTLIEPQLFAHEEVAVRVLSPEETAHAPGTEGLLADDDRAPRIARGVVVDRPALAASIVDRIVAAGTRA